jgi:DNA-directed RNA polymerase specialized sigma24 family protein
MLLVFARRPIMKKLFGCDIQARRQKRILCASDTQAAFSMSVRRPLACTVQAGMLTRLSRPALVAALQALSKESRRAIDLAYAAGCNQAEIADRCAPPLGTIRLRLDTLQLRQSCDLGEPA